MAWQRALRPLKVLPDDQENGGSLKPALQRIHKAVADKHHE